MGLWGAAQAAAFGLGGFFGASAVDAGRRYYGADGPAFETVFVIEAAMFMVAALLALRLDADNKSTVQGEAIA
jgi:BCD family chlorophyll transporter-like MFS transporter